MFSVLSWSVIVTEPGTSLVVHLVCRGWESVGNIDVNISSSVPAAIDPVEDLDPLNEDVGAEVDGEPGRVLLLGRNNRNVDKIFCLRSSNLGRAHVRVSGVLRLPVDAVGGTEDAVGGRQAGRHGGQLSST